MKNLNYLNKYRDRDAEFKVFTHFGDQSNGVFRVGFGLHTCLNVIATSHGGWDHVSVSLPHRCPVWEEMDHIKRLFFFDDEAAMQLHPPVSEHVNNHPFCLHLWRPVALNIPFPPVEMV